MTLQKLADIAGVSVSTVSKVFSGSREISEETVQRILALAKRYGCYEKYYKPAPDGRVIALICPEFKGVHYVQMVSYIEQTVSQHSDTLLVSASNFSPKKQSELLQYYMKILKVDGVIVIEPCEKIKNFTDIPVVQIGMNNESSAVHCVDADIEPALDEAMAYIKSKGLSSIGYIGEKHTRTEYFHLIKAAERSKIKFSEKDVIINDNRFCDCGYDGAEQMILSGDMPDVIFAAYSHIALGIIKKLTEENIRIPGDVSIICMDDISVLPYSGETTSCLKMHIDVLCSEAAELLYRCLENHFDNTKQVIKVTRRFDKGETIGKKLLFQK